MIFTSQVGGGVTVDVWDENPSMSLEVLLMLRPDQCYLSASIDRGIWFQLRVNNGWAFYKATGESRDGWFLTCKLLAGNIMEGCSPKTVEMWSDLALRGYINPTLNDPDPTPTEESRTPDRADETRSGVREDKEEDDGYKLGRIYVGSAQSLTSVVYDKRTNGFAVTPPRGMKVSGSAGSSGTITYTVTFRDEAGNIVADEAIKEVVGIDRWEIT